MLINLIVQYGFPFFILMAAAVLYFKIALYFNIIDKPNERSSHNIPTIRGGGIIFLISAILFFFWSGYMYPYLLAALLASGIISFIDDIRTVNNRLKFGVHILSVILLFKACGLLTVISPLCLIAIGIVVIGVINAYNFMDGINGITGLYSLAVIVPLFLTEPDVKLQTLEQFTIIGLLVFNIFNTRKNARCFAGDVGSISIAVLIVFFLILRIKETNNLAYSGLLLIYGIDTIYTILQRLYQKENIFKPHRKHLYQYFSNERKTPHVIVSIFYAIIQFIISIAIVFGYLNFWELILIVVILSLIYWLLKLPLIRIVKL